MNEISYLSENKTRQACLGPGSHQSIFAGLTEESYHGASTSTWSRLFNFTFHSYNNIEILLFCQISHPELLSVLIIPGYTVVLIPCTYGNIAYIDINCKNNRQMPAAWKVWRIGVKIPFVFALPAPSQCPHTLCIYSPQLSCPGEPTEKLRSWSRDWQSGNSFVSQIRGVFPSQPDWNTDHLS